MWILSLGLEDPLEEEVATHCSIPAWEIPWMEEPGGLQSMGPQRAGHDGETEWAHPASLAPAMPSWENHDKVSPPRPHFTLLPPDQSSCFPVWP